MHPHRVRVGNGWTLVAWYTGARIYSPQGVPGDVFDPRGGESITQFATVHSAALQGDRFVVTYLTDTYPGQGRIRIYEKDGSLDSASLVEDPGKVNWDFRVSRAMDGGAALSWGRKQSPLGSGFMRLKSNLSLGPVKTGCTGVAYNPVCTGLEQGELLCVCTGSQFEVHRFSPSDLPLSSAGVAPQSTPIGIVIPFAVEGGVGLIYRSPNTVVETYGGAGLTSEGVTPIGGAGLSSITRCIGFERGHVACVHPKQGPNFSSSVQLRMIARP